MLSVADKLKISETIKAVEKQTSGEIVTVITRSSDDYFYYPVMWAAALALIFPALYYSVDAALAFFSSWLHFDFMPLYLAQVGIFAGVMSLAQWQALKIQLVPKSIRKQTAKRFAYEQFYAQGLHLTRARTGVLIFVSEMEHVVEIIADAGIHAKVSAQFWQQIVDEFVTHVKSGEIAAGYIRAITLCGAELIKHFPRPADDSNELPNHLVEL